jgi:hypothetical protein
MDDRASSEQCAANLPDATAIVSLQDLAESPALRASLEELVRFLRAGSQEISHHPVS